MFRTRWPATLMLVTIAAAGCGSDPAPGPLTPRAEEIAARTVPEVADAATVLAWSRERTPVRSVWTRVDALPGGLSMAMTPLLVDWEQSRLAGDDEDYYVVHNVNVGGNQARGQLLLGTVRVPAHGVESVEWNMVIARLKGKDTKGGHGQIRFIFRRDALPVVIDADGEPLHDDAEIGDLIFSWEAWRPPGTRWDLRTGLDPSAYALTLRCYDGAVRFVNDSMFGHAWASYPLKLPDVEGATHDQLKACLVLGDSLARRTAREILANLPYDLGVDAADLEAETTRLRTRYEKSAMPDHPLVHHAGDKELSYHLLLRSCITQALATIDLGVQETYRRHGLGERTRLAYAPASLPAWVDEVYNGGPATRSLAQIAPTVTWLARNTQVLPGNAYRILDQGGLLQRDDSGAIVRYYYRVDLMTPYGPVGYNIAY